MSTASRPYTSRKEGAEIKPSPLLALPAELVLKIISQLSKGDEDYYRTLCSLARTCRCLQPLCEECIYATIVDSPDKLHKICDAFTKCPRRAESVRVLKCITIPCSSFMEDGKVDVNLSKLKSLEWAERRAVTELVSLRQGQILQDLGFRKLEKLTIHLPTANLRGFYCLLRHPSLRFLHLVAVRLPSDLPELEPSFVETTPLTTLIFDQCELKVDSLSRILSAPKNLKHLTLSEVSDVLSLDPQATMKSLMPIAKSLETLTHFHRAFLDIANPQGDLSPIKLNSSSMREFLHLKFIDIDYCSLFRGIVSNPAIAPPKLETIRLRDRNVFMLDQHHDLTPYTCLPSVRLLEFIQHSSINHPDFVDILADDICEPGRVEGYHSWSSKLSESGINMKLYVVMEIWEHSKYPVIVYDSAETGDNGKAIFDVDRIHRDMNGMAFPRYYVSSSATSSA